MKPQTHLKGLTLMAIAVVTTFSFAYYIAKNYQIQIGPNYTTLKTDRLFEIQPQLQLPHQHVFYFKTHKTGSTTIHNILAEYCRSHDLIPLLPKAIHFNQYGKLTDGQIMFIPKIHKYDMVFSHHIYSEKIFKHLHNDSIRITSLREPFDNFVSAFLYFTNKWRSPYLSKIPTSDPMTELLRHPYKYDDIKNHNSWTNNRQSMDLGYDLSKRFNDTEYIKTFIKLVDDRFHLVMITEYFDEGLVMMKRMLRWNTEDIIYHKKNAGKWYNKDIKNRTALEVERRELHALFSKADIMLYEHFLNRFKRDMAKEIGLADEVKEFITVLAKVRDFCNRVGPSNGTNLFVPAERWTNSFQITRIKCKVMSLDYYPMTRFMQERQKQLFPN